MKSASVKKRKEKLFPFPRNGPLGKRDGIICSSPLSHLKLPFKEIRVNEESLEEEVISIGSLEAVEATNGSAGLHFAEQNIDGSDEDLAVVETCSFRSIHDSCELAKRKRSQIVSDEDQGAGHEDHPMGISTSLVPECSQTSVNGSVIQVSNNISSSEGHLIDDLQMDPVNPNCAVASWGAQVGSRFSNPSSSHFLEGFKNPIDDTGFLFENPKNSIAPSDKHHVVEDLVKKNFLATPKVSFSVSADPIDACDGVFGIKGLESCNNFSDLAEPKVEGDVGHAPLGAFGQTPDSFSPAKAVCCTMPDSLESSPRDTCLGGPFQQSQSLGQCCNINALCGHSPNGHNPRPLDTHVNPHGAGLVDFFSENATITMINEGDLGPAVRFNPSRGSSHATVQALYNSENHTRWAPGSCIVSPTNRDGPCDPSYTKCIKSHDHPTLTIDGVHDKPSVGSVGPEIKEPLSVDVDQTTGLTGPSPVACFETSGPHTSLSSHVQPTPSPITCGMSPVKQDCGPAFAVCQANGLSSGVTHVQATQHLTNNNIPQVTYSISHGASLPKGSLFFAHEGSLSKEIETEQTTNGALSKNLDLADHGQIQYKDQTRKSWAELFMPASQDFNGSNTNPDPNRTALSYNPGSPVSQEDFNLEFVDHGEKTANLVLKIPKDITNAGKEEWKATLVGRFLGKKLPYSLVTNVTERFWAKHGLIDTLATDSGYFFFTFSCEENRDAVMEGGPWFIAGQPLILRPWKPHFSFGNEEVQTIPIWVNFYGVPLEYWNPRGISFISSFIGKPIRVDRITASRRRITYARVCIEVTADFDFFNDFHIESEDEVNGETLRTKISLEYQWTPVRCKQCSQFGHDCSRVAKPVSRPTALCPYKKHGKTDGEWQVVEKKDKGKQIADCGSHHKKDMVFSAAPIQRGNMFDTLTQLQEDFVADPTGADSLTHSSVPIMSSKASSSHHPDDTQGEVREDPIGHYSVDDVDDCEVDFSLEDKVGLETRGSPLSNRQKKKEAKMKFSGSRPKSRHRP